MGKCTSMFKRLLFFVFCFVGVIPLCAMYSTSNVHRYSFVDVLCPNNNGRNYFNLSEKVFVKVLPIEGASARYFIAFDSKGHGILFSQEHNGSSVAKKRFDLKVEYTYFKDQNLYNGYCSTNLTIKDLFYYKDEDGEPLLIGNDNEGGIVVFSVNNVLGAGDMLGFKRVVTRGDDASMLYQKTDGSLVLFLKNGRLGGESKKDFVQAFKPRWRDIKDLKDAFDFQVSAWQPGRFDVDWQGKCQEWKYTKDLSSIKNSNKEFPRVSFVLDSIPEVNRHYFEVGPSKFAVSAFYDWDTDSDLLYLGHCGLVTIWRRGEPVPVEPTSAVGKRRVDADTWCC